MSTEQIQGSRYEPLLNSALARMLNERGIDATPETSQPGSRRQLDITVRLDNLVIALEGERGSRTGALRDAQNRLDQARDDLVVVHKSVAINYPNNLREPDFGFATRFEWAILPSSNFALGTVDDLVATLRRVPEDYGDPENLAQDLNATLDRAVSRLSDTQKIELARTLNLATEQTVNGKLRDRKDAAAKRGMLVIAAAAMFHARLDEFLAGAKPDTDARTGDPFDGVWPPMKLQACISVGDVIENLAGAWDLIVALDYRPIFEVAHGATIEVFQDQNWKDAVHSVARAALRIQRDAAGTRHDLLGRIFHRLLDSARYDGSFYTSTSAAVILAGLAINEENIPERLSDLRIIDPACGTGTLLMAASERVRDFAGSVESGESEMIENVVWGLDVNTTACHMAATTLGLLSPSTLFHSMNIHMMPLEAKTNNDVPTVGSLELLDTGRPHRTVEWSSGFQRRLEIGWTEGHQIENGESTVDIYPNSFDVVIMNPPFTRDSLRHDQFSKEEEALLKDREKVLMQGRSGHGSSSGTMFIDLGEHLTKLDDSAVLATVFPLAGSSAPSAREVRRLLADWFHIEYVVWSHDPQRPWFSENTTITEMLVVARRHPADPEKRPPTRFVCLRDNSRVTTDAVATASSILNDSLSQNVGLICEWPADRMVKGEWRPLGFSSPRLVNDYEYLATHGRFMKLDDIASVGPAGQGVREIFSHHDTPDSYAWRALWNNDPETRKKSLQVETDRYIHTRDNQKDTADRYWALKSRLLLCVQPRLNTVRITAAWVPEPTIGSAWVPCRPNAEVDAEKWEKAMSVWFNSTLGLVSIIGTASPRVFSRPALSMDAMRRLPVPKFTPDEITYLSSVFDFNAETEILTLAEIDRDAVRLALDDAVCDVLGLSRDELAITRRELMREPAVTG